MEVGPAGCLLEQQTERDPKHHCKRTKVGIPRILTQCVERDRENVTGAFPFTPRLTTKNTRVAFPHGNPRGFCDHRSVLSLKCQGTKASENNP